MEASVIINLNDVYYNVKNNSYVTGASRNNGDNFEFVANMQASNDTEHKEKILRAIQSAQAELLTKLAEYYPVWEKKSAPTGQSSSDNGDISTELLDSAGRNDTTEVVLRFLRMPSNYNTNMDYSVSGSVQQYLYNQAMVDWFLTTNKQDATEFADAANENIQKIRKAINKRVKPVRTTASAS